MLILKNCSKNFKDVIAIDDISLRIEPNTVTIIEGESGAGKSTLLKILGLIDLDFKGVYTINNKNIATFNNTQLSNFRNGYFGYIFQNYLLIEQETAYQNILIPLLYTDKFKKSDFKHKIHNVAQKLKIENLLHKKVNKLSGGERQRVAIARALVNEPTVILMDEPTSALNKKLSDELMDYIYDYVQHKPATLIIISHTLNRVARKPYMSILMKDGKITHQQLIE